MLIQVFILKKSTPIKVAKRKGDTGGGEKGESGNFDQLLGRRLLWASPQQVRSRACDD